MKDSKCIMHVVLIIAVISLGLAVISRLTGVLMLGFLLPNALLRFTDTLLLLALNLGLLQLLKPKAE